MKIKLLASVMLGAAMVNSCAAAEASLGTDLEKLSYSIGVDLGNNIKKQGIDINVPALALGIQDAINGKNLKMTDDQMKDSLIKFQKDLMAKRTKEFEEQADKNKAEGSAFLKENKSKQGVFELQSGLQYKVVKTGTGAKPKKEDTVTVQYTGRLINGKVFDSTDKTGKPATFKLDQVIPGWTEALQLMPVGSIWEIYVPANLAYGERNIGGLIGPNSTLIFNVHLLSIGEPGSSKK